MKDEIEEDFNHNHNQFLDEMEEKRFKDKMVQPETKSTTKFTTKSTKSKDETGHSPSF